MSGESGKSYGGVVGGFYVRFAPEKDEVEVKGIGKGKLEGEFRREWYKERGPQSWVIISSRKERALQGLGKNSINSYARKGGMYDRKFKVEARNF